MNVNCNTALSNLGNACKLNFKAIKRFGYTSLKKEDGTYNTITVADAAAIANWKALFDKYNFSSDVLEKIVVTPVVYEVANEQADPETFDTDGYYEELRDGDYTITFKMNSVEAYIIKKMRENREKSLAVYMFDAATQAIARKISSDLYPLEILSLQVQNLNLKTFEGISQSMVTMRLKFPEHMNELTSVQVADADYASDSDFYSLNDVDTVITSPAVTGCIATLTTDKDGIAVTGLADDASDYLNWVFYDNTAPTVAIPLAAAGSISEGSDGVYTINEAAILTTGHVYKLKVSVSGYDIEVGTVTVP